MWSMWSVSGPAARSGRPFPGGGVEPLPLPPPLSASRPVSGARQRYPLASAGFPASSTSTR